ncbi:CLUMA_CG011479, isoform A [Clunio marinus]|uniref:CLUMA_CG011479, isoform A n=1 Tax=Clunio marinus TaxID=568069 RepID=A0A1J1ICV2_9DIPT|nr:CLUMA_CG011479, isoform A [Clunio marinus]
MIRGKKLRNLFEFSVRQMCSKKNNNTEDLLNKNSQIQENQKSQELPDEPTNCCMSGCENCVWIQYAKELTDMYKDSGETARKTILQKIKEPSMQIFIQMELRDIDKKKTIFDSIQTKSPKTKKD